MNICTATTEDLMKLYPVRFPPAFINDCIATDCIPVSTLENHNAVPNGFVVIRETKTQVYAMADAINLAEIYSRADYYANEADFRASGLGRSAKSTIASLDEQGFDDDTVSAVACELRFGADR